jgi:hypothetical protein
MTKELEPHIAAEIRHAINQVVDGKKSVSKACHDAAGRITTLYEDYLPPEYGEVVTRGIEGAIELLKSKGWKSPEECQAEFMINFDEWARSNGG